jgi:small subunit ribosomal protein S8
MHYDLLAKIKNAYRARKEAFSTPYSGLNHDVAKLLVRYGFIKEVAKRTTDKKLWLDVKLAYPSGESRDIDFSIVSKPSRRVYSGYRDVRAVRQGYGIGVLSTPRGVMTNAEARQAKVGGEYLFQIW